MDAAVTFRTEEDEELGGAVLVMSHTQRVQTNLAQTNKKNNYTAFSSLCERYLYHEQEYLLTNMYCTLYSKPS